jgi:hypothetical protein
MPEEEEGFTFVDKRRASVESAPVAEASPSVSFAETAVDTPDEYAAEDDLESEGPPDVYSLIGYCLSLLQADAWQKMGLLADPQTGLATVDLAQAKVAIDVVGDLAKHLEAAPLEAVPDSLRRDLRILLNDLRLNFVSQQNKPA